MMIESRKCTLAFCVLGLGLLLAPTRGYGSSELAGDVVVARVDGVPIHYSQIQAPPQVVDMLRTQTQDSRDLEKEARLWEARRLYWRLRGIIADRAVEAMGITVSPEQVDMRLNRMVETAGMTDDDMERIVTQSNALAEALRAWYADREAKDTIYQTELAPLGIMREQWEAFCVAYPEPDDLQRMVIPDSPADMIANSRQSTTRDLILEKLDATITANIRVSEPELLQAYHARYPEASTAPDFETVRARLEKELLDRQKARARQAWWAAQFAARVEYVDERFSHALTLADAADTPSERGVPNGGGQPPSAVMPSSKGVTLAAAPRPPSQEPVPLATVKPASGRRFPWWLPALGVAALILAGGAVLLYRRSSPG